MKFSIVSLLALSNIALAKTNTRGRKSPSSTDQKRRLQSLSKGKGGKGKKGSRKLSHHNADYQDHYLVSFVLVIIICKHFPFFFCIFFYFLVFDIHFVFQGWIVELPQRW